MNNLYNHELYHHGIKGQKWGRRNGPPYPLGSSQLSSAERREQRHRRKEGSLKVRTGSFGSSVGLNAYEHKNVRNKFKAGKAEEARTKKESRIENKRVRLEEKGRLTDKKEQKLTNKREQVNQKYAKKIEQYNENSRHYQTMINNTIGQLKERGYSVSSTKTKRYVNYGRMMVINELTGLATLPLNMVSPVVGRGVHIGLNAYLFDKDPKVSAEGKAYLVKKKQRKG